MKVQLVPQSTVYPHGFTQIYADLRLFTLFLSAVFLVLVSVFFCVFVVVVVVVYVLFEFVASCVGIVLCVYCFCACPVC